MDMPEASLFAGRHPSLGRSCTTEWARSTQYDNLSLDGVMLFCLTWCWRSGELFVGMPQGVVKTTAIRRVSAARLLSAQAIVAIQGVAWSLSPLAEDRDTWEALRLREPGRVLS